MRQKTTQTQQHSEQWTLHTKKVVTKNPDYSEYNNKNKAEKERKDAAAANKRSEAAKKKNALQYKVYVKSHADDLKNILGTKG